MPNQTRNLSDVEREIEKCQIHTLVYRHAENTQDDKISSVFLKLLEQDRLLGVRGEEERQFKDAYERLMQRVLSKENVRVVATTWSTLCTR